MQENSLRITSYQAYDDFPYESFSFSKSHPVSLSAVCRLFGVKAPDFFQCRVLELGCASGGNIIPMAMCYPDAEYVGVDYSAVQIEQANKHCKVLGIDNIEFKHCAIEECDEDIGLFDYIIAHGVLSWVPHNVQEAVFDVIENHLSQNGVVYISYNTLPGWNAIKTVRDMMLFHTEEITSPDKKLQQAKQMLAFVTHANHDKNNAYAKLLEEESAVLKDANGSYMIHEHLEENNHPFYFRDFVQKGQRRGLDYIADASLSTMNMFTLPQETVQDLSSMQNDFLRNEQYMDFVTNRRFRSSLLCKQGKSINRNIEPEILDELYVSAIVTCPDIGEANPLSGRQFSFTLKNQMSFASHHPGVVAAFVILSQQEQRPVLVSQLMCQAIDHIKQGGVPLAKEDERITKDVIRSHIQHFVLLGAIDVRAAEALYRTDIPAKPEVWQLPRYQSTYANWVTNLRCERISLDNHTRQVIRFVDGTGNTTLLTKQLEQLIVDGAIDVSNEYHQGQSGANKLLDDVLEFCRVNALLVL